MLPSQMCQKAPSAKRCIKTARKTVAHEVTSHPVRKHRAPKGALRQHNRVEREVNDFRRQKAPSGQNFARNSLLSTLHQLLEVAEFQRSDFKHRNNRPVITCNNFEEPSVARTKRSIKTVSALNARGYRCSLG